MTYQDPDATYYEERYRQRILTNVKRRAQSLGYQLTPLLTEGEARVS